MKRWYQFYYEKVVIRQQLADEFEFSTLQRPIEENGHQLGDHLLPAENRQQPADELNMPELFGQIPWFHHVEIFTKCKSLDEALFYIKRVANEGWSRSWLEDQIAADLFKVQFCYKSEVGGRRGTIHF